MHRTRLQTPLKSQFAVLLSHEDWSPTPVAIDDLACLLQSNPANIVPATPLRPDPEACRMAPGGPTTAGPLRACGNSFPRVRRADYLMEWAAITFLRLLNPS